MQECDDGHPLLDMVRFNTGTFRKMMLILIIYGYVYMLIALGIIVIFPIALCVLKAKSDD